MKKCSIVAGVITLSPIFLSILEASWSQRIKSAPSISTIMFNHRYKIVGGLAAGGAYYAFIQHKQHEYDADFRVLPFERDENARPCGAVVAFAGAPSDLGHGVATHVLVVQRDHSWNNQFGKCVQHIMAWRANDQPMFTKWQPLSQAGLPAVVEKQIKQSLPEVDDIVVNQGTCSAQQYKDALLAGQGSRGGAYITTALSPYPVVSKEAVERSKVVLAPGISAEDILDDLVTCSRDQKNRYALRYWKEKREGWLHSRGLPGAQIVFTNSWKH